MATPKTQMTDTPVGDYLAAVEPPRRREDALRLDAIFREVTGFAPRMWGPSMIGYGRYDYVYDSGRGGSWLATGFAPRKANLVVYIMPGYADFGDLLERLGKHRKGKACLYINTLADIDVAVLQELIAAGLADLARRWTVHPT